MVLAGLLLLGGVLLLAPFPSAAGAPAPERPSSQQAAEAPHVASVDPAPLTGSTRAQWLTITGRGFSEGFTVRLKTAAFSAHIDDPAKLEFVSSEEVRFKAVYGTEATPWHLRVVGPEGQVSNEHTLRVEAPAPRIEVMGPVRVMEGSSVFTLTVYSNSVTSYSVLRWNGQDLPTTPLRSSDNPNALTIGLEATVPEEAVASSGRNAVRIYTPPPGGGRSSARMLFTNPRPFYWTTWFYVLVAGGVALAGWAGHRWRVAKLREHELRSKIEERTRTLHEEKQKTERQAQRLRKLNDVRKHFFANVSNEFRTPLTLIETSLHALAHQASDEDGAPPSLHDEALQSLGIARRNTRHLKRLTRQLIDLTRLEAGQAYLQSRRGDLLQFAEDGVRLFSLWAEQAGVALTCSSSCKASLAVDFDPEKLQIALRNLLSNAIKFTPEGGTVAVAVARDEAHSQAVLTVEDTGSGIAEEALPHVFNRFWQAGFSEARTREGSGIGLTLAKALVELHGGTLGVESEEGVGTTFTVRLPLAGSPGEDGPAESRGEREPPRDVLSWPFERDSVTSGRLAEEEPAAAPSLPEAPPADPTVLVVENDAGTRLLLRHGLTTAGYQVEEAKNGQEALEFARTANRRPDLVLSDIMMPEMNGLELCQAIKSDEALSDLPVVLLTARIGEAQRVQGLREGANDYIEKPFSMAELQARIRNLIQYQRTLRAQQGRGGDVPLAEVHPADVHVTTAEEELLQKAQAVVEAHIDDQAFTVDLFAQEMTTTKRTLSRRLKAAVDLTPARFVKHMRLQRAAQLLEQGMRPIAEVARAVGYTDAGHFSRIFREQFGTAPSAYPGNAT